MEQKQYTVIGKYNQMFDVQLYSLKENINLYFLIKANKENFSEQIKLDTLSNLSLHVLLHIKENLRFYTEKRTLHWIAFAVMTFI
jgi:hypothetical protein